MALDPSGPPFFSKRRRTDPHLEWMRARKESDERLMAREHRLNNLHLEVRQSASPPRGKGFGYSYNEKRERGLCTQCSRPSEGGESRCSRCKQILRVQRGGST
jgi:hypothetical protein